jgi:uncharacterized Zn finger protein
MFSRLGLFGRYGNNGLMRESARTKGARYVSEARLTVTAVDGEHVVATCRGSGALYNVGHDLGRGWHCDCPARTVCAHINALCLVVVRADGASR